MQKILPPQSCCCTVVKPNKRGERESRIQNCLVSGRMDEREREKEDEDGERRRREVGEVVRIA